MAQRSSSRYHATPESGSRLVYLAEPAGSQRILGFNSVERGMVDLVEPWFRPERGGVQAAPGHRTPSLVIGSFNFLNWLLIDLEREGVSMEFLGRSGGDHLFLVDPSRGRQAAPGASAVDSPSLGGGT